MMNFPGPDLEIPSYVITLFRVVPKFQIPDYDPLNAVSFRRKKLVSLLVISNYKHPLSPAADSKECSITLFSRIIRKAYTRSKKTFILHYFSFFKFKTLRVPK